LVVLRNLVTFFGQCSLQYKAPQRYKKNNANARYKHQKNKESIIRLMALAFKTKYQK
jgi:hypothetical protein